MVWKVMLRLASAGISRPNGCRIRSPVWCIRVNSVAFLNLGCKDLELALASGVARGEHDPALPTHLYLAS